MQSLADSQRSIANAMVHGDATLAPPALTCAGDPRERVAIHLHHYESSLTRTLCDKFPATDWLLGSDVFLPAVGRFIRENPPHKPCLTEYGTQLPPWLAQSEKSMGLVFLESFVQLEWQIGQASIAIDKKPLPWHQVAGAEPDQLMISKLELQPGLHYLQANYNIDELIQLYLNEERPESFQLIESPCWLEVRGSRGAFAVNRISKPEFVLLTKLNSGHCLNDAATDALDADTGFDAGQALRNLVASKKLVSISGPEGHLP